MESSLLSGEEIEQLSLVRDSVNSSFRASTYDLRVAEIIPAGVKSTADEDMLSFALEPGGMVRVISRETLHLSETVTAHVLLKNELCRQGILAINIGVVDPGFEGPLSSTLINFGKETFFVKRDATFLRVSFIRCRASPKAGDSLKWSRPAYVAKTREEVKAYAGPMFLDLEHTASRSSEKMYKKFRDSLLIWSAVAVVAFALFAILVPLAASYTDRWIGSQERRERAAEQRSDEKYEKRINALEKELSDLRRPDPTSHPVSAQAERR